MGHGVGLGRRMLFAIAAIGAACVMVGLLTLSWNLPDLTIIAVYFVFVIAGGLLVAIPIVVVPAHFYAGLPWIAAVLGSAVLGPAALTLVFLVISALQGSLSSFSLAGLGLGWPLSMIAATSAICVYVELIKRSIRANT